MYGDLCPKLWTPVKYLYCNIFRSASKKVCIWKVQTSDRRQEFIPIHKQLLSELCSAFGFVLAKPSAKSTYLLQLCCVVICCGVETKYTIVPQTPPMSLYCSPSVYAASSDIIVISPNHLNYSGSTPDYDDYTINDNVFAYMDEAWGPHTIDRFIITIKLVDLIQSIFSLRQTALMLSRKIGLMRQINPLCT